MEAERPPVNVPENLRRGVALFNAGEFWEAHEAWEDIWQADSSEERIFWQGLIQVAAAFHHLGNRNWNGMRTLLRRAEEKLVKFLPTREGVDVERLLREVRPWREELERERPELPGGLAVPRL